jgi:hypothetical protein
MNRLSLRNRASIAAFYLVALTVPVVLAVAASTFAAGPWDAIVPMKKVDANPNSMYPIAQTNGPWMIMATTFRGDKAGEQAQQLVYELRSRYRLSAYTYEKTFDFSKPEQGRGLNPDGTPKMMHYQNGTTIREVAVLVGDYETVDDGSAQTVLKKLKTLEPDCLKSEQAKDTQSLGTFRQMFKSASANKDKGPMGHAFIATNPLLPKEYFAANGVDKFVLDMNKGVAHSLLDCKGHYSVKVATFSGTVLIDQSKINEVEKGKKTLESRLADAADKAHTLTEALRKKGYEAYEFHDRETSIVCIGSYDSVGYPRADGKIEINPEIHKLMDVFGADQKPLANGETLKPRHLAGIPLDIQPIPVEVPRRSISADYQRSMRAEQ